MDDFSSHPDLKLKNINQIIIDDKYTKNQILKKYSN